MWPPEADRRVSELLLARHYGSVPTLFGAPGVSVSDLSGADVAFLGIPWQAPVPDSRMGGRGRELLRDEPHAADLQDQFRQVRRVPPRARRGRLRLPAFRGLR